MGFSSPPSDALNGANCCVAASAECGNDCGGRPFISRGATRVPTPFPRGPCKRARLYVVSCAARRCGA
eukprot:3703073-Alexandrium_andersonii.AAC.1